MKSIFSTSLLVLLCTLGINSEEIKILHQPSSYTINDFNKSSEINAIKCESDNDCLSNSCVEGICDFYFLCPENGNCVSLQSDAWKTYDSNENNEVLPETYKPILKSCYKEELHTNFLAKLLSPTCETEKCEIDNDCLFGSCYNNTCITESPIYKCSSQDLECKRANFIECNDSNQCHSGHCISGFCLENTYPSLKKNVIKSFMIAIAIRMAKSLISYIHKGVKKNKKVVKKNKKSKQKKIHSKKED